jgi:uncharacterized RDD family membrane protein YckC
VSTGVSRGIVTPEAVVLEFETASVGSRALGQAVDLLCRFAALYVFFVVLQLVGPVFEDISGTVLVVLTFVASFLLVFGYPAIFETAWRGQTPGKRAVGLRVVTVEGAPVTFRHSAIRSMLGVVDFFVPPIGVAATISVLLSPSNQRLGDLVAGTIVLRERTGAAFPVAVSFPPLPGYEHYAASLDVGGLRPEQYALIRSFLVRVNQLHPQARARLAVQLANPVAQQMHHTPPPTVSPEAFLVSVAAAYQRRHGGPPVPLPPWISPWGANAPAAMARR